MATTKVKPAGDGRYTVHVNGVDAGTVTRGSSYDSHARRTVAGSSGWDADVSAFGRRLLTSDMSLRNLKDRIAYFVRDAEATS